MNRSRLTRLLVAALGTGFRAWGQGTTIDDLYKIMQQNIDATRDGQTCSVFSAISKKNEAAQRIIEHIGQIRAGAILI